MLSYLVSVLSIWLSITHLCPVISVWAWNGGTACASAVSVTTVDKTEMSPGWHREPEKVGDRLFYNNPGPQELTHFGSPSVSSSWEQHPHLLSYTWQTLPLKDPSLHSITITGTELPNTDACGTQTDHTDTQMSDSEVTRNFNAKILIFG